MLTTRSAGFERLEVRTLLAADFMGLLDSQQASLDQPGEVDDVGVTLTGGGPSSVVGFHVRAADGSTLDPAAPRLEKADGSQVLPLTAMDDTAHSGGGLLVAAVAAGEYRLLVGAEPGSTGAYRVDVFLVGDTGGDGRVGDHEWNTATGAAVQAQGSANHITERLYRSLGIDLSHDLYDRAFDANGSGRIDSFDLDKIANNRNLRVLSAAISIEDTDPPQIAAQLRNDTGRADLPESFSDGTTGDVTGQIIVGSVTDSSGIARLSGSIDSQDDADFGAIDLSADGTLGLTLAELEQLAGGTALENTGRHTLRLVAEDDQGNLSDPFEFTFELDTRAPAPPANLDLLSASDTGLSDQDDITRETTPTIGFDAEDGALVELFVDGSRVGQGAGSAGATITTDTLDDGDHAITAVATDAAGNRGESSAPLTITIDTQAPQIGLPFDLLDASDTPPQNDHKTAEKIVGIGGTVDVRNEDPGAIRVTMQQTGAIATPDTLVGAYQFDDIPLPFGESQLSVAVTDLAGNETIDTQTFIRNGIPVVAEPIEPIAISIGAGEQLIDLSGLFDDPDLGDGDTLTLEITQITGRNVANFDINLGDSDPDNNIEGDQLSVDVVTNLDGNVDISIRATDSLGEPGDANPVTSVVSVTVTATNTPPTALDGSRATSEDAPIEVDLRELADDAETPDAELVFQVDGAVHGTAQLQPDGHTVLFTPEADFSGTASFAYRVTDQPTGGQDAITSGPATVEISVAAVNDPPAAAPASRETDEDMAVTIDLAALVTDVETAPADLSFSVSDAVGGSVALLADGHTARFTPAADSNNLRGPASFRYSVTDTGDGASPAETASDILITIDVRPVNDDPQAVDDAITVAFQGVGPGIDVLANDLDADLVEGDTLSITAFDAVTSQGALVTQAPDGTLLYDPNGQFDDLAPGGSASDSFTYTIEDAAGNAPSTATVMVTIRRAAPPSARDDAVETDEETPLDIDVLADNGEGPDTDPDGDDGLLEVIDFDAVSVLGAAVTQNADGTLRYDPRGVALLDALARDTSAVDTFQYTVRGEKGQTATATVSVTVRGENDPPVARPDQASTDEATPIVIDVRADNGAGADFDPDTGDALAVTQFDTVSTLGAAITELPDGTLRYDPSASTQLDGLNLLANALDTFQYTIADPFGGLSVATVTVTVAGLNDPPQAEADTAQTDADHSVTIDVLANDTDPDVGETLVIDSFDPFSAQGAAIVQVPGGLRYDPTAASALVALAQGESVQDTFDYTIVDAAGASSTATVTVTVTGVNDPPLASDDAAATAADIAIDIDVVVNDSDPETPELLTVLNHDPASSSGAALSLNADGTLHYDPTTAAPLESLGEGATLLDSFAYTVSDGRGGLATATVRVTVTGVNDPPTAAEDAAATDEKMAVQIGVVANDTDPDSGDTLLIDGFDTTSQLGAAVSLSGEGILTYDPTTSGVLASLGGGVSRTDTFGYSINDGHGGTAVGTVTVTVTGVNDPPSAVPDAAATDADQDIDIDVVANDTDPDAGDTLAVERVDPVSAKGASLAVNPDGTVQYDPGDSAQLGALAEDETATDTFTYTVTDGTSGSTSTATVTVTVRGVNDPPRAADDAVTVSEGSGTTRLDVLANDSPAPDVGEILTVIAVGPGSQGGDVEIAPGGEGVDYAPANGFSGTETFTYTVSDGNGGTDVATVTVTVESLEDIVEFSLETTDPQGNPVTSVAVGDSFVLKTYVQDIRAEPTGVFSAFLDVTYETGMVSVAGTFEFGDEFANGQSGDSTTDGLIDEAGGFAGFSPLGGARFLLWSLPMTADAAGTVHFQGDPKELAAHPVAVFGDAVDIPVSRIRFGSTTLTIVPGSGAVAGDEALAAVGAPLAETPSSDPPPLAARSAGTVADPTILDQSDPLLGDRPSAERGPSGEAVPFYGASGGRIDEAVEQIAEDVARGWEAT